VLDQTSVIVPLHPLERKTFSVSTELAAKTPSVTLHAPVKTVESVLDQINVHVKEQDLLDHCASMMRMNV